MTDSNNKEDPPIFSSPDNELKFIYDNIEEFFADERLNITPESVKFTGQTVTSESVLRRAAATLTNAPGTSRNGLRYSDLKSRIYGVVHSLSELGHIDAVHVAVSPPQKEDGPFGVTFDIDDSQGDESGFLSKIDISSSVSENDIEVGTYLTNVLGNSEKLGPKYRYRGSGSHELGVSLWKPFLLDPGKWGHNYFELKALQQYNDRTSASSYRERVNGIDASLFLTPSLSYDGLGQHTFGYRFHQRNATTSSATASHAARESAGQSVKSSLYYEFNADIEDPLPPFIGGMRLSREQEEYYRRNDGVTVNVTSELAGVGTGVKFLKSEARVTYAHRIFPAVEGVITGQFGVYRPLGSGPSHLTDRLQFNMRGFRGSSIGPHAPCSDTVQDAGANRFDALGGNVYTGLTAALRVDLQHPLLAALQAQGQVFANIGNNIGVDSSQSLLSSVGGLSKTMRSVIGVGIVKPFASGPDMEINLCYPLSKLDTDRTQRLQLRFGFHLV